MPGCDLLSGSWPALISPRRCVPSWCALLRPAERLCPSPSVSALSRRPPSRGRRPGFWPRRSTRAFRSTPYFRCPRPSFPPRFPRELPPRGSRPSRRQVLFPFGSTCSLVVLSFPLISAARLGPCFSFLVPLSWLAGPRCPPGADPVRLAHPPASPCRYPAHSRAVRCGTLPTRRACRHARFRGIVVRGSASLFRAGPLPVVAPAGARSRPRVAPVSTCIMWRLGLPSTPTSSSYTAVVSPQVGVDLPTGCPHVDHQMGVTHALSVLQALGLPGRRLA